VSVVNKIVRTLLGFASLLISVTPAFGQSPTAPNPEAAPIITARTNIFVDIPNETLVSAEEVASEILRRAGVEVIWINCDFTIPSERRESGCARPLSYLDFVLNIVDRIQALKPNLSQIAMGAAVVLAEAGQGDRAYVGLRQAVSAAHVYSLPLETILGMGVAHEFGHLLLGENAHAPSGLMKARWGADELKLGSHGSLTFLPEQSDRIRANLLARQKKISHSTVAIQIGTSAGDRPQAGPECSSCSSMPIPPITGSY
jgi:hypothetical protein